MSVLVVDQLYKAFEPGVPVVDGVSFRVEKGAIVGLLGPNGAGKTTTIAMILGITTPTTGTIKIFDMDMQTHRSSILSRMNYSSAYTKAPDRMRVIEHLRVFAKLYEISDGEQRIDELLTAFRLQEHKFALNGDLSSGNMARVNLCKAFLNRPELVLLDEPTSSLDPDIADTVRSFILDAQKKYHTTILITSHNMSEIEQLCDRVVFMHRGKVIAEDTPQELSRKIETARIHLMMKDGQKRTVAYCKKHRIVVTQTDRSVVINTKEKLVAGILSDLATLGVSYTQISIDTPTLEDYFLTEVRI